MAQWPSDQHTITDRSAPISAVLIWAPLAVAAIATGGSLWLSTGMGLKACPLCFYQRTFAMSVLSVLAIGLLAGKRHWNLLPILAFPLAIAGFGVAAFHVNLELSGKLECPPGALGLGTAPQQSCAIFTLLVAVLIVSVSRTMLTREFRATLIGPVVGLGAALAAASVVSSPPLPPAPTKAYDTPLEICRPPFRPS